MQLRKHSAPSDLPRNTTWKSCQSRSAAMLAMLDWSVPSALRRSQNMRFTFPGVGGLALARNDLAFLVTVVSKQVLQKQLFCSR